MARRDKEKEEIDPSKEELDPLKLSKLLIREFNKDETHGKLAWCLATDPDNPTDVKEFISTGSTILDYICTNRRDGGVPVGKLTEISGEEASGKSLLCAHLAAEVQRRGGLVVYIDTENAMNPAFARQVGVKVEELVYLQPGTVEEVGEAIEKTIILTRAKAPNRLVLIIWDSVAGTPCQAEVEGNYDPTNSIGLGARATSKMLRKLTQVWGKERIAMVFTNQLKTKIGQIYGDPMTTPYGKAIPYHASLRIRVTRSNQLKEEDEVTGIRTLAKVMKTRLGPPHRKCEFNITFAYGIDDVNSWFTYLHERGDIEKADGWCFLDSYPSGKIEDKGAKKGQDRGARFRERGWAALVAEDANFRAHVLGLLEKNLVIKFGDNIPDLSLDPESLMDNEAVIQEVTENA